eukprot:4913909-Alexandrium_andersonii.AAC.1
MRRGHHVLVRRVVGEGAHKPAPGADPVGGLPADEDGLVGETVRIPVAPAPPGVAATAARARGRL